MRGVFATSERAVRETRMREVLAMLGRRGPDAEEHASPDPDVILGHTRLAIIGLGEAGRQPQQSLDGSVTVSSDGEIYNYQDLGRRRGHPHPPDTAVLADVPSSRQVDVLSELRGMFAFAAWDSTISSLGAMRDPCQPAGHAYAAVVPAFVSAALEGRPIEVFGDGRQTRDFTYVGSVFAVIAEALHRRVTHHQPVNLAFGSRTSLLALIDKIAEVLGIAPAVQHRDPRAGDAATRRRIPLASVPCSRGSRSLPCARVWRRLLGFGPAQPAERRGLPEASLGNTAPVRESRGSS
jgi:hypothetical protein